MMKPETKILKDRFGRVHDYVRISVTDKCNLRCVYCMPEEGLPFFPDDKVLSGHEIIQMVENFAAMGVKKIRLTGGEPLLRQDIEEIITGIAEIPEIEDISVTTNGLALVKKAEKLYQAGLNRLNISLDTFDPVSYKTMTRGGQLQRVLNGIEVASQLPFDKIKINTVIINGQNDHEMVDFLKYSIDHDVNVRFIEFMPISQENKADWAKQYMGIEQVFDICDMQGWKVEAIDLAGNGPSDNYKIVGGKGSFGLIHPISCNFCESCNRLRVTADGCVKSCLYWDEEDSVREEIADFSAFEEKIQTILGTKPENHEMALAEADKVKDKKPTWRHMSQIGG
ncbi:GTP 3',8-cyclase MoaA [Enterococcus sp. AZ103]|uniref:GTP 3',8-cyclase MoaA n=1 Tax=Enterococcus sp. AZ103 TaxID=2774628 RepID=UPI003F26D2F1